jgi:hypothetical protein
MRPFLAALAASAITAAVCGTLTATARPRHVDTDYQAAYEELYDGLQKIDRATDRLRDKKGAQKIRRLVDTTLDRASAYLEQDDYYEYGVSDADFELMAERVSAATYADDQLALVQELAQSSYFTVAQVVALMKVCTYEDTRIEVAVALYPRISDPANWYLVNDGLTYSSSKRTLRERIGQ